MRPDREHRIGEADCLPKTQLLANTKVEVVEATPAQLLYPKRRDESPEYKDNRMAAVKSQKLLRNLTICWKLLRAFNTKINILVKI